ncbi:MAG: GNAT family N-acetyltransferase [Bacteroidota bacterium]
MKILETDRLILRQITPLDFKELFKMNSDAQIMKYVGDGSIRTHQQMTKELEMLISHYTKKPGLGIWATELKVKNCFVGASGLVYYDNTPEIEVGYRMKREFWNNGYATEASKGLLRYGFEKLNLKKIVSSAHVENVASRRVLEKIGMSYVDDRVHYKCLQAYYEIRVNKYQELYKANNNH